MSSLDFAECKIVQRSSDYKNIVDPLTKCIRISRDDFRRADPLTKCIRVSRDDARRIDPLTFLTIIKTRDDNEREEYFEHIQKEDDGKRSGRL